MFYNVRTRNKPEKTGAVYGVLTSVVKFVYHNTA